MTAIEVKEKLAPIPDENWKMGSYSNHIDKCCALGHLHRLENNDPSNYCFIPWNPKITTFREKVNEYLTKEFKLKNWDIALINDAKKKCPKKYKKIVTPKARVLALLEDMIEAGY
ncbi:MAG: hypothetical protein AAF489_17180 [Bacteroidota bacterium]